MVGRRHGAGAEPMRRGAVLVGATAVLAAMRAMQGRFEEARQGVGEAMNILADLGMWLRAAFVSETSAFVERLAGDDAGTEDLS